MAMKALLIFASIYTSRAVRPRHVQQLKAIGERIEGSQESQPFVIPHSLVHKFGEQMKELIEHSAESRMEQVLEENDPNGWGRRLMESFVVRRVLWALSASRNIGPNDKCTLRRDNYQILRVMLDDDYRQPSILETWMNENRKREADIAMKTNGLLSEVEQYLLTQIPQTVECAVAQINGKESCDVAPADPIGQIGCDLLNAFPNGAQHRAIAPMVGKLSRLQEKWFVDAPQCQEQSSPSFWAVGQWKVSCRRCEGSESLESFLEFHFDVKKMGQRLVTWNGKRWYLENGQGQNVAWVDCDGAGGEAWRITLEDIIWDKILLPNNERPAKSYSWSGTGAASYEYIPDVTSQQGLNYPTRIYLQKA